MRELNIKGCMGISENAIFEARPLLRGLRSINISHYKKINVLVIACLCSLDSLQEIRARGIHLEFKELLRFCRGNLIESEIVTFWRIEIL